LIALVLVLAAPLAGCIRDFDEREQPNRMNLRGIDLSAPSVTTGTVTLTVSATLENRGAPSDSMYVVVRAFDTETGFLVDTQRTDNRTLDEDTTTHHTVTFTVPRKSGYRVEVDVYEAGQVVETGRVTVHNVAALEPTTYESSLKIDPIEVSVTNVSGDRVRLDAEVYLTNQGSSPSRSVDLQVKARSIDTGLLADEARTRVPEIQPERTQITRATLTVADDHNYRIDAVAWDDNVSVERGTTTVQLLPRETIPEDEEVVTQNPNIEDFVHGDDARDTGSREAADGEEASYDESAETPGPGAMLALVAIGATATVAAWRRS
jgi:hypothetical protein